MFCPISIKTHINTISVQLFFKRFLLFRPLFSHILYTCNDLQPLQADDINHSVCAAARGRHRLDGTFTACHRGLVIDDRTF